MRRAAVAALLSLVLSVGAFAGTPKPILPVPDEAFRPVLLAPGRELTRSAGPEDAPLLIDPTSLQSPPAVLGRPKVDQPEPKARVVASVKAPAGKGSVSGLASWYCRPGRSICPRGYSGGMYAAAGPALRAAICGRQDCTSWRGKTVLVNGRAVKLVDWCQCYWKQPHEKVIDLFWDAWVATRAQGGVRIVWH